MLAMWTRYNRLLHVVHGAFPKSTSSHDRSQMDYATLNVPFQNLDNYNLVDLLRVWADMTGAVCEH